jgi:hypothetical protein
MTDSKDSTVTGQVSLSVQLPEVIARRLTQAAAARDVSVTALVLEAIENALPALDPTDQEQQGKHGYRWKDIFLPDGTMLSFNYKGTTHLATVAKTEILYEGRSVSPSEFVNSISGAVRNAWRDIWVKRPSDPEPQPAYELRREATAAKLARLDKSMPGDVDPPRFAQFSRDQPLADGSLDVRRRQFGSLPVSDRMGPRYFKACQAVAQIIETQLTSPADLEHISEVKGMFNRAVRRDRHDWQHVQQMLGMVDRVACRQAAVWLVELRNLAKEELSITDHCKLAIVTVIESAIKRAKIELEREGFDALSVSQSGL